MGLSSKQFSSDGHGWNQALLQAGTNLELQKPPSMARQPLQQQEKQSEPLKCPRCDSTNTKFCYYNNYNKSQPRYFCKTCKRHWTKGGTLRNVPVGGGRKTKRLKASKPTKKSASKTNSTTSMATNTGVFSGISNHKVTMQAQQPRVSHPLAKEGLVEKNLSDAFYQTVGGQRPCSLQDSFSTFSSKSLKQENHGIFVGSLSPTENDENLQFPHSNLGNFESKICLISSTISSIQPSNLYNYTTEANLLQETVMHSLNTSMSSSSVSDHHQPWTISMPTTICNVMDMSSNWDLEDFDKFVSVEADLTIPWDDIEIKP